MRTTQFRGFRARSRSLEVNDSHCFLYLLSYDLLSSSNEGSAVRPSPAELDDIRERCEQYISAAKPQEVLNLLESLEEKYYTLAFDSKLPSLYNYKGVAYFELNLASEASSLFSMAVEQNKYDINAWMNLYNLQQDSEVAYIYIEALTPNVDILKRIDYGNWHNYEYYIHEHLEFARTCLDPELKEFCDSYRLLPPIIALYNITLYRQTLENSMKFSLKYRELLALHSNAKYDYPLSLQLHLNPTLKIGLLLTRIEHSPVIVLIQGLLEHFRSYPYTNINLYGIFLYQDHQIVYEWQEKVLHSFDEIIHLTNLNLEQSAKLLYSHSLDVLIDMNGASFSTGLFIFSYRPAALHISHLGDPYTTGTDYVDYFLTDAVATPAEYAKTLFTEKLMFLSTSYMANSHASWQKHLVKHNRPIDRETFLNFLQPFHNLVYGNSPNALQRHPDRVYFGSFHGPIKIDPDVFHIWMNILRRVPNSEVVMSKPKANLNAKKAADILDELSSELKEITVYNHHRYYNNNHTENRLHQCAYHGIDVGRVSHISTLEWHEHLHMKSGFTLYLDTLIKNGHSTSVDAMFASIPMIALGDVMHSTGRSTQSISHYAQSSYGIVNTLKEYEDIVIRLTKSKQGRKTLEAWRSELFQQRSSSLYFDTQYTTYDMIHTFQAGVDIITVDSRLDMLCTDQDRFCSVKRRNVQQYLELHGKSHFHIFPTSAI